MKNVELLRKWMRTKKLDAFIIPSNDPHFSEYVADYWKCREWISGFDGSAGTVVVTQKNAALWTDSRYFIQAAEQLKGSGIELKKVGLPETETIENWLAKKLTNKAKIGVDEKLFSIADFENLCVKNSSLQVVATNDPFIDIWKNRPAMPTNKAFLLSKKYAGKSISEKKSVLSETLNIDKNTIYIVSALDEIAWLLNLRGADIDFNPTAIAYAAVEFSKINLFIDTEKISKSDCEKLKNENVVLHEYSDILNFVSRINKSKRVILNRKKISVDFYNVLKKNGANIEFESNENGAISSLKAIKNKTELNGFRQAMIHDGLALVRFWRWMEENIGKQKITEIVAAEQLHEFRAQSDEFVGESFSTISSYGEHGAIVHYSPTPETDIDIEKKTFYLVDSGGQYKCGTTDITRTIHFGAPTNSEKTDYTLVLKGNIALSMAKFPAGTRGAQLDMLARQPLCSQCKNYLHGTGHGIGHFLNVHEGPQSIRMNENPVVLEEGMVTSNEPGIYVQGKYGIRIENLIVCVPYKTSDWGDFLQFETITLCPIDTKSIDKSLLAANEIAWLNDYHKSVYNKLSPYLNAAEKQWLKQKTKAI